MISLIVAASTNNVIGVQGKLPWRLPADLKRFKSLTMGKPIVMGRLTFASLGRPLPGRRNIVITRNKSFAAPGCDVVASPAAALRAAGGVDEVMIIGGGQIYDLFLPKAGRIYLTRVHTSIEGDAWFPGLDAASWELVTSELHTADDHNDFDFEFNIYDRFASS